MTVAIPSARSRTTLYIWLSLTVPSSPEIS